MRGSKLDKIKSMSVGDGRTELQLSVLYGRVSALSDFDFSQLACQSYSLDRITRNAVRARLAREAREGRSNQNYDRIVPDLLNEERASGKFRRQINSLLSLLYPLVSPSQREIILHHWIDRGTKDADNRWLKAISSDQAHFNLEEILAYWRRSHADRAAAVYIDHAAPERISAIIPELIEYCVEGWVVARAIRSVGSVGEDVWQKLKNRWPSTVLYLHAKLSRMISKSDAIDLVISTCREEPDKVGLAIWAVGIMQMEEVLDEIMRMHDELERVIVRSYGWE